MSNLLFSCYVLPMLVCLIGMYFFLQKDYEYIVRNRTILKSIPFIPFVNQMFMFYFIGFFFLWIVDKVFIRSEEQ